MTNFDDLDDPRPDHERAANGALGTAVAQRSPRAASGGQNPAASPSPPSVSAWRWP